MVSDIATATSEVVAVPAPIAAPEAVPAEPRRRRRRRFSPLTRRILAVNILALALLGVGLLFLGQYRQSLVDAELQALKTQAQVFSAAIGEGATSDAGLGAQISLQPAREMMRRLIEPTKMRAQLLDSKGAVIADTAVLGSAAGAVHIDQLAPPEGNNAVERNALDLYDWIIAHIPWSWSSDDATRGPANPGTSVDPVAQRAFAGDVAVSVRGGEGHLTLLAAAPVQYYRQVLGVLLLASDGARIEQTVRDIRLKIIELVGMALGLTVLLSFYLAGTIVRPVRRLAAAAERVRRGHGREVTIERQQHRQAERHSDELDDLQPNVAHGLLDARAIAREQQDAEDLTVVLDRRRREQCQMPFTAAHRHGDIAGKGALRHRIDTRSWVGRTPRCIVARPRPGDMRDDPVIKIECVALDRVIAFGRRQLIDMNGASGATQHGRIGDDGTFAVEQLRAHLRRLNETPHHFACWLQRNLRTKAGIARCPFADRRREHLCLRLQRLQLGIDKALAILAEKE